MCDYSRPDTLAEALKLKAKNNEAYFLAGGTDLTVAIRSGKLPKKDLIDISALKELKGITLQDNLLRIGAMETFTQILESSLVAKLAPSLGEAAAIIASNQIRNRASIGGNICNASSAADSITPLLCHDAILELSYLAPDESLKVRTSSLDDFLTGHETTNLGSHEILTAIILAPATSSQTYSFRKIGRRNAMSIARLNGCCMIDRNNSVIKDIRIALGAATAKPERVRPVEDLLRGKVDIDDLIPHAGVLAAEYIKNITGIRASSSYKLPVTERFVASLIKDALGKES